MSKQCYTQNMSEEIESRMQALMTAAQHQQAGELHRAQAIYQQLLALDPSLSDVHHLLGLIYRQQRNFSEAQICLQRAVHLSPKSGIYRNSLGAYYYDTGNLLAAVQEFKQAVELLPNNVEMLTNLGCAYRSLNKLVEAQAIFLQAIKYDPNYARALASLALTLLELNDTNQAEKYLQTVEFKHCTHPAVFNDLGKAYQMIGDLARAEHYFRQALKLRPDYAAVYYQLSCIREFSDSDFDLVRQIEQTLQAEELTPTERADLYLALAKIYRDCGETQKADECLGSAKRLTT